MFHRLCRTMGGSRFLVLIKMVAKTLPNIRSGRKVCKAGCKDT